MRLMTSSTTYPEVEDEFETLNRVLLGQSLARFGDGEFNLVRGGNCVSQHRVPNIQAELRNVLRSRNPELLVAIPRLDKRSPKFSNWTKCCASYGKYLIRDKTYYSAFITRPDSAPWIATQVFFDRIERLWAGKDITMVYGSNRSLNADSPPVASARCVEVVECDYAHTYHRIDQLEQDIITRGHKTVLLMCGPTATCLAARLAKKNFHAIDLGHIGMWWRAYENPKLQLKLGLTP